MLNRYSKLATLYKQNLLEDVIPFWQKHSIDHQHGGYFTCLSQNGVVFDTDKFMWLQARQVWMFSKLYNTLEPNSEWLNIAKHGTQFLKQFGRDENGHWYFSLTREGLPLVQPYSIFSDCFAAMAFSQYAVASSDDESHQIALDTFHSILQRLDNPKGQYSKYYPGTRPLQSLAIPMILANVCEEMEGILGESEREETIHKCIHTVMNTFLDSDKNVLRENMAKDGTKVDSFEGRLCIPGHGIEAMWFILDIARKRSWTKWYEPCVSTILSTLEYGWDQEHEGIFYFLDLDGKPPQQLEWDQKLWWVHLETLVAILIAYEVTGDERCWKGFEKVHEYSWNRFPDSEHGEWYGYLNRYGEVLLPLKGGKWKGCFHVPRALLLCSIELERLAKKLTN